MWIRIFTIIGVIISFIGFASIPDDIEQWKQWIGSMSTVITPKIARWLLASFGILLVIALNVLLPYLSRRKEAQTRQYVVVEGKSITSRNKGILDSGTVVLPEYFGKGGKKVLKSLVERGLVVIKTKEVQK